MKIGKHGITSNTPKNILFGAGTFHKNLVWDAEHTRWNGDCIGATTGGGKVTIQGEYKDIELDGALVKVKGLTVKVGGKATMEINMAELTEQAFKLAGLAKEATSDVDGYALYKDKAQIEEGDYLENFRFVGKTADGSKELIVIFESALCTSGLDLDPKNKDNAVNKYTIEAYADADGDLDTLPVKIYYTN